MEETKIIKNKYYKIYKYIIYKAKQEKRNRKDTYYENHHIIPKSFGGSNKNNNLVLLTPREHFIVHACLTRFTFYKPWYHKSCKALGCMRMYNKHTKKRYINSIIYHYNKIKLSKVLSEDNKGEKNGMYGKTHTVEVRKILSDVNKNIVVAKNINTGEIERINKEIFDNDNNYVGANIGKTATEETKEKMRNSSHKKFTVKNIETNQFVLATKEEYYKNYNLVTVSYGGNHISKEGKKRISDKVSKTVSCRYLVTGQKCRVPIEIFNSNKLLVGVRSKTPNIYEVI